MSADEDDAQVRAQRVMAHPVWTTVGPMIAKGEWDAARGHLQKIAYGIHEVTEQERQVFTDVMNAFASADPLYRQCLDAVLPVLAAHPQGVKQTALYAHMPAPDVEIARYVLYYASVRGEVRREKKGNSYLVFAPGASHG